MLLFAAQFGIQMADIPSQSGLLFSAHFYFVGVALPCTAVRQSLLESPAHFPVLSCPSPKSSYCYRRHNSRADFSAQSCYSRHISLRSRRQQPRRKGCYSQHILKQVLQQASFADEFPGFYTQDCYSAHNLSLPSVLFSS